MANVFQTVDWMMQEALDLLVNKLSIAAHFNTEVQKEFERDFAPGETVRVKFPQEYLIRDGLSYTEQPLSRRSTTVSCNQIFGIDFGWDSFERAVKMERGNEALSREYIEPAMAQLAQEIESRCALWAKNNASNIVGVLGTDPTDFDTTSASARQRLIELGCPTGKERAMIVPPSVMRLLKKSAISYFNPVADIAKQFREGIVGSGDGFEWYESVSLYSHTAGTMNSPSVYGDGQSGTSLTVTLTASDVVNVGDVFSIASVYPVNPRTRRRVGTATKQFVCTKAIASAAGSGTDVLEIWPPIFGPGSQYQNVDALPANSAVITLFPGTTSPNAKVGTNGLAIHKDAFALVGVPFEMPKAAEVSKQLRDDETGIPLAFVRMFDPISRRMINRFDCCIGFGNLWSDNCAVRILGA